eukprot:366040-Chlamydomonas_euryale.AAC.9
MQTRRCEALSAPPPALVGPQPDEAPEASLRSGSAVVRSGARHAAAGGSARRDGLPTNRSCGVLRA